MKNNSNKLLNIETEREREEIFIDSGIHTNSNAVDTPAPLGLHVT